jgi:hypothetical protein
MLELAPNPPTNGGPPYVGRMLLLPTGQVMFASGGTNIQVYTPSGSPDPTWLPTITTSPSTLETGHTYTLYGRQINGLSQAVSYGDDAQMATNYPIVRVQNNASGHATYCKTSNHSTLGVNTGTTIQTTQFAVPAGTPLGASQLAVIANGIASAPVAVGVAIVKLKEFKELKVEIKELIVDKAIDNAAVVTEAVVDPGLMAIVSHMAQRIDEMSLQAEQSGRSPFIRASERPALGSSSPPSLPPPSGRRAREPQRA